MTADWVHDHRTEEIALDGHAFRPMALPDGSIGIEEVDHATSKMVRFDPPTKQVVPISMAVPANDVDSALSPDGKWLAFTSEEGEAKHLWLRNEANGQQMRVVGGNCDSSWPAWEPDSQAVIFASDCGRGLGLSVLYRAQIPEMLEHIR